jgi:hypothetical protein
MINKYVTIGIVACTFMASISFSNATEKPRKADKEKAKVILIPGWVWNNANVNELYVTITPEMKRSCSYGMLEYTSKLLGAAAQNNKPPLTKPSYYAYGTFLGYFSNDPVEKESIADKVAPVVDRDLLAMSKSIKEGSYFLVVGDLGAAWNLPDPIGDSFEGRLGAGDNLPSIDKQPYSWEDNSFAVKIGGRKMSIPTTAKEWKEKWQPVFAPENRPNIAGRILLNSHIYFVMAEIFDKKTGATLLKWGAKDVDANTVNRLSALIKDSPAKDYDVNQCGDLNASYFTAKNDFSSPALSETETESPEDALANKFNSFFKK